GGSGQCAATILGGNYRYGPDSRLISPVIDVPVVGADEEVLLRYREYWSYASLDRGDVQVSVYTDGAWSNWSTLQTRRSYTSVWQHARVDLTAYVGQRIRIAFLHVDDTETSYGSNVHSESVGWYIDDIEVRTDSERFNNPEDFEALWGDWWTDDYTVWQIGQPTVGPPETNGSRAHSPMLVVATLLGGSYPKNKSARLVSPRFVVPSLDGDTRVILRFWHWFDYGTGDSGKVQIKGAYDAEWVTLAVPAQGGQSTGWQMVTVDLTSYQRQQVRLGFLHAADNDSSVGAGWYIDDLSLSQSSPSRIHADSGASTPASFSENRQSHYFVVNVPAGGHFKISLDDLDDQGINELYIKRGSLPTPGSYDYKFDITGADQSIFVPDAGAGNWFILVYNDSGPVPGEYTLNVVLSEGVILSAAEPNQASNTVPGTIRIEGAEFAPNSIVSLVNGADVYQATDVAVVSASEILAEFDFTTIPEGSYQLRVSSGGSSADLPFSVFAGAGPQLSTRIIVPRNVGYHAVATIWVEYENTGDVAMPSPLLEVSARQNGRRGAILTLDASQVVRGFWTATMPEGFANSVQFLAHGAIPGILQPGESGRVPVYYAGWQKPWDFSYRTIYFDMGILNAENADPIDWDSLKDFMRPPGTSEEAWSPVFSNLRAQTGSTWGDYVHMLNDNARYLAKLGETVTDVQDLLAFEIEQSSGLGLSDTLTSALDAQIQAPGLSLTFTRSFGADIPSRYAVGRFGRGWSDNWDYQLEVADDGTVTLYGPNKSRRVFQPDSRSASYFSQTGDYAALSALGGGVFSLTESDGMVYLFRADGKLDYLQDTHGNRVTTTWSGDLLTRLAHSAGPYLDLAYDGLRLTSLTDNRGRVTSYAYDATGEHLLSATDYRNQTTGYTYGPAANEFHALTRVLHPDGVESLFSYDELGRIASKSGCNGTPGISTYAYGNTGKITVTDPLGHANQYYLNHRGQVARTIDPLGNVTSREYDDVGNLVKTIDPAGREQVYTHDELGNLASETNALGYTTRYLRGALNRLATLIDAKGNVTRYGYEDDGDLESITYPDDSRESWTYDAQGNRLTWTNRRGQSIDYTNDSLGRVATRSYPDGTEHGFQYDADGNLTSYTDPLGTTTREFDEDGRLIQITYPGDRWLRYTYDGAGRRSSMTDQLGHETNYHYDEWGRLAWLSDETSTEIVRYAYDGAGRVARKTLGNGIYTTYSFDDAGQLLELANLKPDDSILSRYAYTYDERGRRDTMTTTFGVGDPRAGLAGTWTYDYDDTGQLVGWTAPDGRHVAYSYDPLGNRLSVVDDGADTAYSTNWLNQYTQVGDTAYEYDDDGNLMSQTSSSATTEFQWTVDNKLLDLSGPDGVWVNHYDANGSRVKVDDDGTVSQFVFDPSGLGNLVGDYDGAGSLNARYEYGSGLVSRVDSTGSRSYYTFDALGNVSELVDESGSISNAHSFLPFGELLFSLDPAFGKFQFVGEAGVANGPNGLNFMRARHYVAEIGRFISPDPVGLFGDSLNTYRYAKNTPTSRIDPSGLSDQAWGAVTHCNGRTPNIVTNPQFYGTPYQWCIFAHEMVHAEQCRSGRWGEKRSCLEEEAYKVSARCSDATFAQDQAKKAAYYGRECRLGRPGLPVPPTCDVAAGSSQAATLGSAQSNGSDPCKSGGAGPSQPTRPRDPNELVGPVGYGTQHLVAIDVTLPYRISFENESDATAPAQIVTLSNPLSAEFDWSTFELSEIAFGDHFIAAPPGSQHFVVTKKMIFNGVQFEVQIEAGIRLETGEVYARFTSIDPTTGLPPPVDVGFLPPEDGAGRGQGHVAYIVRAKADLSEGTGIRNVAEIVFDGQPPIATNLVDPHDPSKGTDPEKEALITIAPKFASLSVSSGTGGAVSQPGEGTFTYSWGEAVTLQVVPDTNAFFIGWSGDAATIADPGSAQTTIGLYEDFTITANFALESPVSVPIDLKKGFNLIALPRDPSIAELGQRLEQMALDLPLDGVDAWNIQASKFEHLIPYGVENPSVFLQGQEGLAVYANDDTSTTWTSIGCPAWNLKAGINLVGSLCTPQGTTAHLLLSELGGESRVSSIVHFNTLTGRFESAAYIDSEKAGPDFPIENGQGYLIYMKEDLAGFRLWE
ncbi:MAG: choice-of-anchor J domain-containing protein, partial [Gammaproteobacteria bacterium]|nr:choice-of-anchor J domain-containing protein [Gammaproteobacteria bacterium]